MKTTAGRPLPTRDAPVRVIALRIPSWRVLAVQRIRGVPPGTRLAVVAKGTVLATSRPAAQDGVRPGLKIREAQLRCPEIVLVDHDPELEMRAFADVLRAVQDEAPHVHLVRPGLVCVRAAGLARFYGSEHAAALALRQAVTAVEITDVRAAAADGVFAAGEATRLTSIDHPWKVVRPGESAVFLAPLPIDRLTDALDGPEASHLLRRLGVRTVGAFASLPEAEVHARFGPTGLHAHRLARGLDTPTLRTHEVDPDLSERLAVDPPTTMVDPVVHAAEASGERFIGELTRRSLVCQAIRVTVEFQSGNVDERIWRHPWPFTPADVHQRVRWQLQDLIEGTELTEDEVADDQISAVVVHPVDPAPAAHHEQGLWGERPDAHVLHAISSLQQRLGHTGVLSCRLTGGRLLHQRVERRPWGDAPTPTRGRRLEQPWPGALPGLLPGLVHEHAEPAVVTGADGVPLVIDDRGTISARPCWLTPTTGRRCRVVSWSGPWPVRQHWWRPGARRISRFQLATDTAAWVLVCDGERWWSEARYE